MATCATKLERRVDMPNAKFITKALGGTWFGLYGLAMCPAHENTQTPALSLSDGSNGKLLTHCFSGCSFAEIINALREKGITTKHQENFGNSVNLSSNSVTLNSLASTSIRAQNIWLCAHDIMGTPGESYLQSRGIEVCDAIQNLRYTDFCYHPSGELLSAVVALIEGGQGNAVHCSYVDPITFEKENIEPQKAMFGPTKGGAVRLIEGGGGLIVAEGIETCLSIQSGINPPPFSAWATLSASNMRSLTLPPQPSKLIIAADGDTAGRQAAYALAERATALGWNVAVSEAPDGMDWNDVLQGGETWP